MNKTLILICLIFSMLILGICENALQAASPGMPAAIQDPTLLDAWKRLNANTKQVKLWGGGGLTAHDLSQLVFEETFPIESDTSKICGSGEFARYGMNATGFTQEQEEIILQVISAYAKAVGGAEQIKKILTIYNGISCQEIYFDPEGVGAATNIRLSPTVFNIQKALAAHYSIYFSSNEGEHARIVIGHEIGHLLGRAAQRKSGVDWFLLYQAQVHREWETTLNQRAFEEEAVTQLSLEMEEEDFYYSIQDRKMETDPQRKVEIQAWVADFLQFLREL